MNIAGNGAFLPSRAEAVAQVRCAQATGVVLIDVGCMQVNLRHHPAAFASLDDAFEPSLNVDYAARFLIALRNGDARGDWIEAAGMYHSRTPDLAASRRRLVLATLSQGGASMGIVQPVLFSPAVPRRANAGGDEWARRTAAAALRAAGFGIRLRQLLRDRAGAGAL